MKTRLLFFILLILTFACHDSKAATINWVGSTSSSWNTGSNWSTGNIPTSSDNVQIGVSSFAGNQPVINSSASCSALTIGTATTVTLTVNAPLSVSNTITVSSGTINSNSSGTISAANVNLSASTCTLNGTLTISGALQTPSSPGGNSTLTTNAAGNTITGGIAVHTSSNLTWNGSGTTTCGGSTIFSTTTFTVGSGNTINFTGTLTINSGSTPGFLVNNGYLTFTSCSLSTGGPSSLTTAVTNNSGATITLTGAGSSISLGSSSGLSNSGTITGGTSTSLLTGSGSKYTNNSGGVINLTGAAFSLTGNASLDNSGNINLNTASTLTSGNPGSITNSSGANITATASTITLNGGTNLNNSGAISCSSASTFTTSNPVTLTNNNGASLTFSATTVNFNGGTTINNSGTISGSSSTTITAGNPVPITNSSTGTISLTATTLALQGGAYINNSGSVSALSGSTITFANPSYINNSTSASTLTVTASTLSIGGGGYITNSGTVTTSASSAIGLNGNPSSITNTVNATFNASSTTVTMVGGSTITNTGGTFTATSSPFTLSGFPSSITNQNSGATTGVFAFNACPLTFNGSNSLVNSGTISLNNGSSVTMSSSGTNSLISNSGTFYAGTSNSPCTITMLGSQSQISNSGTFYLGSTSAISLGGNSSSVSNSNLFTIQSDINGSGTLSATGSSATGYSGTYKVERYISGGTATYRGYRLFSSPVYGSTDGNGNHIYSLNYVQLSSLVTGSSGGGFDKTGNPSLYLYRENIAYSNATFISGNFRGVSVISTTPTYSINGDAGTFNVPVGNGFLFWFRGDRTSNLANKYTPGTIAESVTMTATGTLNQGQVKVRNWYTPSSANLGFTLTAGNTPVRGDNLVGNPYASSIDWDTFQSTTSTSGIYGTSLGTSMYILNPVNQNYGAYIKGGAGVGTNNSTNIIASGQGFFVVASCSCAQLFFNETAKSTAQTTGVNLFMGAPTDQIANSQYLRLQLAEDSVNTDDILVRFSTNASATYNANVDAPYKQGFGAVSLASLSSDHIPLAISTQPLPKTSESIPLSVNTTDDGTYSLSMKTLLGIPQLFDIWLMDAYKKDSLDMRHNTTYTFNVLKSDTNTFGSKRFSLVLRQNPAYAYHLLNFTATKAATTSVASRQVQVVWTTENEQNYTNFTVERSTDSGKTFDVIGSVTASALGTYSLVDKNPADGQNLYRLKQEDLNNTISYSAIIPVEYVKPGDILAKNGLNVFPNPASSTINLAIATGLNAPASYNILITNSSGLVIKQATSVQPNWQTSVSNLLPGTYVVKVLNTKDQTLIGNTKFVKL